VVVAFAFLVACVIGGFVLEPESVAQTPTVPTTTETVPVTPPPSDTTTTTVPVNVPPVNTPAPAATPPDAGAKQDTPPAESGSEKPTGDEPGEPGADTAGGSGEDQ